MWLETAMETKKHFKFWGGYHFTELRKFMAFGQQQKKKNIINRKFNVFDIKY